MPKASVKVMRSYDYCHFEVTLGTDEDLPLEDVDALRKQAARLVDKAVEQYKISREVANKQYRAKQRHDELAREAKIIRENYPQSEWTPEQQATVKALDDWNWDRYRYDYDDDYDNDW